MPEAIEALEACERISLRLRASAALVQYAPDLLEAYVRAGRREEETTERLAGRRGHDEEPEAPDTAAQTDQSLFRYGGENREI
jgi:hypothetical protein